MTVCEHIDKIIQSRGISRRFLAMSAGISPSSFQSAMQRNTDLSLDMLVPIAKALGLTVGFLKGEEEYIPFRYGENCQVYDENGNNITDYFFASADDEAVYRDQYEAISKNPEFEKTKMILFYENDELEQLCSTYFKLNKEGKSKAVERIEELAEIPKYQK